jgi:UDP-N-acetylmuramoyl-tripeptide--D-alanyl-D-alanine ligase
MNIREIYDIYRQYPHVTTDSRTCDENAVFFALKGENFDGNKYVSEALKKGCSYAIGDSPDLPEDSRVIRVDDSLKVLQELANYHRRQLDIPVIAITGTNGKTTTKELTAAVLAVKYKVLYTEGNLNNQIGVPLTLLKLTSDHEIAIIEMGASHPGDIHELVGIAEPNYGLITNVGKAHLEGFGSFEGVIRTKGELYEYIQSKKGKIFMNKENVYLNAIAGGIDKIYYGIHPNSQIWGNITGNNAFLEFEWHEGDHSYKVLTRLAGNYNLENALAAIAIGNFFKVPESKICNALENYTPRNNRSQLKETDHNHLIIDAYNANPTSMQAAVENFAGLNVTPKAVILGDMKELGENSILEHQKIIDLIGKSHFDKVILCGEIFSSLPDNPYISVKDVGELSAILEKESLEAYFILIKGSHSIWLDKIIDQL